MPAINPDKAYAQMPLPKIADINLPPDWLKKLEQLIIGARPEFNPERRQDLINDLNKHAGPHSTYTLKSQLHDSLKLIYSKLAHADTSADEKESILLKLLEGIGACTPGFHDRANEIVFSLSSPANLDDLLARIRQGIVTNAAVRTTDEIHAYNRFFVIAQQMGYGIRPLNPGDIYPGALEDHKIESILKEAFSNNYGMFGILNAVQEELKSFLTTVLGYTGRRDGDGYTNPEYSKFLDFLHPLINIEGGELFVMSDDYSKIYDINFQNISKALLSQFIKNGYFNFSPEERTLLNTIMDDSPVELQQRLKPSRTKGLIASSMDLIHAVNYLKESPKELKEYLITQYITSSNYDHLDYKTWLKLPDDLKLDALQLRHPITRYSLFDSINHDPTRLYNLLTDYPEALRLIQPGRLFNVITAPNRQGNSILHDLIVKPAELMRVLNLLPDAEKFAAIRNMNERSGKLLLQRLTKNPDLFKTVFQLLPINERVEALLQTNRHGITLLSHLSTIANQELYHYAATSLPAEDARRMVTARGFKGEIILHTCTNNPKRTEDMLTLLPENERMQALKMMDIEHISVIDRAVAYPVTLKVMLMSLPEKERFDFLKIKSRGTSLLTRMIKDMKVGAITLTNNDLPNSIIPLLFNIYNTILNNLTADEYKNKQSSPYKNIHMLLVSISDASNFDDIKKILSVYIHTNPDDTIANMLTSIIPPEALIEVTASPLNGPRSHDLERQSMFKQKNDSRNSLNDPENIIARQFETVKIIHTHIDGFCDKKSKDIQKLLNILIDSKTYIFEKLPEIVKLAEAQCNIRLTILNKKSILETLPLFQVLRNLDPHNPDIESLASQLKDVADIRKSYKFGKKA